MTAIETLAAWITEAEAEHPAIAVGRARNAFLDTVGCIVAGAEVAPTTIIRETVAGWGTGPATLIGTDQRLAAPWAALVNGTAAHARDFDDWEAPGNSHASAVLVPALLALAEERGLGGGALIDAYIVGFEVLTRVAEVMTVEHYERGWHPTGTLCTLAATAACARLLGLDQARAGAGLSVAASMAAGVKAQMGYMAKPTHAGLAAKAGVMAASLAERGLVGSPAALDGPGGWATLTAGTGLDAFAGLAASLGAPLALEQASTIVKRHPSCGCTHRAVDAALAIREAHEPAPANIAGVICRMSRPFAETVSFRQPATPNAAMFSMSYCTAVALIQGRLGLDDFTPEALHRPEIQKLEARVEIDAYAPRNTTSHMTEDDPDTVIVEMVSGERFEETVGIPLGAPGRPIDDHALATKFRHCASWTLDQQNVERALARLSSLDELADIASLTAHLSASASTVSAARSRS